MDVEDVVLNPDPRVCCFVVRLYVYEFESLWKFMVQHLIGGCAAPLYLGVPWYWDVCCVALRAGVRLRGP